MRDLVDVFREGDRVYNQRSYWGYKPIVINRGLEYIGVKCPDCGVDDRKNGKKFFTCCGCGKRHLIDECISTGKKWHEPSDEIRALMDNR